MKPSTKDEIKGKAHEVKGKVRGRRYIPVLHISDWLPRQPLRELKSTIEKLWRDFLQQNGD